VAYKNELIERAWFLSPVTDMERIIHNAINYCSITEKDFEEHQTITTPIETLYWKYYLYVKLHPLYHGSTPYILCEARRTRFKSIILSLISLIVSNVNPRAKRERKLVSCPR
jgi:hypothetical protein